MSKKNFLAGRRITMMAFREMVKQTKNNKNGRDKRNRNRNQSKDEPEYKKVHYPVWVQRGPAAPGILTMQERKDFPWPEYKTDAERIRLTSRRNKNKSIVEAFADVYNYNIQLDPTIEKLVNSAPTELRIGDEVEMPIRSVTRDGVVFNTLNYKQIVNCNTNLYKFENFKRFIPKEPVKVRVIAADHNRVTVDPLAPMLDEWLTPILNYPEMQRIMSGAQTIKVKDLRLTRGGYVGRAVIPNISKYVGEDYTIEAFIPGSQIVLNIENDFEKWNGKTVEAFVTSYIPKPNTINQMSLICSVKERLKFEGDMNLMKLFNMWCDADARWEAETHKEWAGVVTGILNSSKKCGVYVEIPELNITGMVSTPASELCNYKPQDAVIVRISDMEEEMKYDQTMDQMIHTTPYVVNGDVLEKCTVKPVLQFVSK